MSDLITFVQQIVQIPLGHLAVLLGLSAIALAAFAIHAVTNAHKKRRD